MFIPDKSFKCFTIERTADGSAICGCLPGKCVASIDGARLGRVSILSDIICKDHQCPKPYTPIPLCSIKST